MDAEMIRCYFDFISPYAYLAWRQLPHIAVRHGVRIEPVPVLFAGLLNAHGQKGPAEIPAKRRWLWQNVLRKAKRAQIPIRPPAFHPFNPLLPLRLCSLDIPRADRLRMIDEIFAGVWVKAVHVADPAALKDLLDAAGFPAAEWIAATGEAPAKARLRDQTEQAIAAGVFGVPTFDFGGRRYWGEEELEFLEQSLAGEDPLADMDLSGMEKVQASAQRQAD